MIYWQTFHQIISIWKWSGTLAISFTWMPDILIYEYDMTNIDHYLHELSFVLQSLMATDEVIFISQ